MVRGQEVAKPLDHHRLYTTGLRVEADEKNYA